MATVHLALLVGISAGLLAVLKPSAVPQSTLIVIDSDILNTNTAHKTHSESAVVWLWDTLDEQRAQGS